MVMGLLAKLLLTKQLQFKDGLINFKELTMTLLPSVLVGELTEYFLKEKKIPKLYMISWYWGFILVRHVVREFKLKKAEDIYSLGMDLGEALGIGLYKTHDYYPGRYTHFVISNNPFLKYLDPEKYKGQSVDAFISGCMAGGGCFVHNAVCQNIETKCKMRGDEVCDFLTGTEQELKNRGLWEKVYELYNLDKLYPLQKDIFKNYTDKQENKMLEKIIDEL